MGDLLSSRRPAFRTTLARLTLLAASVPLLLPGQAQATREEVTDLFRQGKESKLSADDLRGRLEPVDAADIAALRTTLFDADPYCRRMAAQLLGDLHDGSARLLARLLADDDEGVRAAAERSLVALGGMSVEPVASSLSTVSPGSDALTRSLRVLGALGDPKGAPAIGDLLIRFRGGGFRHALAFGSLKAIGLSAAGTLVRLSGHPEFRASVLSLLQDFESEAVRFTLLEAMSSMHGGIEPALDAARLAEDVLGTASVRKELSEFYGQAMIDETFPPASRRRAEKELARMGTAGGTRPPLEKKVAAARGQQEKGRVCSDFDLVSVRTGGEKTATPVEAAPSSLVKRLVSEVGAKCEPPKIVQVGTQWRREVVFDKKAYEKTRRARDEMWTYRIRQWNDHLFKRPASMDPNAVKPEDYIRKVEVERPITKTITDDACIPARRHAIEALGDTRSPEALLPLIGLYQKDETVLDLTAAAIVKIDKDAAYDLFMRDLRGGKGYRLRAAVIGLSQITDRTIMPELASLLDSIAREGVWTAMAARHYCETRDYVLQMLGDRDESTVRAALTIVSQEIERGIFPTNERDPELIELLIGTADDTKGANWSAAGNVLMEMERTQELIEILRSWLNEDADKQFEALRLIDRGLATGKISEEYLSAELRQQVTELTESRNGRVARAARDVLQGSAGVNTPRRSTRRVEAK